MGIQIISQTNEQECGVCALTALHNYFYNEEISKEEMLETSHISEGGMTIFDFEQLGTQIGLECESYEINISEFLNLKINNYFVLLISTNLGSNHYVIARKKKNYLEIYDSCSLKMTKMSYKDIAKIFMNIIILVHKNSNKTFNKVFGKARTLLMFDLKFVLLNLALSILLLVLSIGTASFLNFVIDLAIGKGSINNLITICFIFVFMYFCNDLVTYISNLYMSKHIKSYLVLFTSKMLSSLSTKQPSFLSKVDKNWIFKVDECAFSVANFCIVEINKFLTSIIFCFVCICVIGSIQYYLLIFVVLYIVIETIFFLFSYRKKQDVFLSIVRSENANAQHYKNLIFSLQNEMWSTKRRSIIDNIKNNYSSIYKNYHDVTLFKSNSSLFKSLIKSFTEVSLIAVVSILIIKSEALSIGKLTFVISAFSLLRNSLTDFYGYFLAKIEFDVYWQVYKDITVVGNLHEKEGKHFNDKIKTIGFKMGNQIQTFETAKNNKCLTPVIDLIKNNEQILINGTEQHISNNLFNSLVVINQQTNCDANLLSQQISKDPFYYSQYIKYFEINFNKTTYGFYESLIINILCLLREKNKIVVFDDVMRFIQPNDKQVVKQMINTIKKSNYVFVVGREEND